MTRELLVCAILCISLASCGGDGCKMTGIAIQPPNATADHNAASPGNTTHFVAAAVIPGACPITAVMLQPDWTSSDTTNVTISSAKDSTNGTATCLNATATPATVTATLSKSSTQSKTFVATAKLTCN